MFTIDKNKLKKLNKIVKKINSLEDKYLKMSDSELQNMTAILKEKIKCGEKLESILPDAFAVCREASERTIGLRHYDVQLLGGIVLHQGDIAEMKTGEGKTLVAICPAYLNALSGKKVHIVTVNEYLAQRDKENMSKVFNFLNLKTGVILSGQSVEVKKEQYACDIVYGTNSEFGFDYLRNNLVKHKEEKAQSSLNFAIIDEADSILIDEARTPLIITQPKEKPTSLYVNADLFAKSLDDSIDISINEKERVVILTDEGINKAEKYFRLNEYTDIENIDIVHHINQALMANYMMKDNIDYIVQGNQVLIVDTFTGRVLDGRRYSQGLHQAIEAKENVDIMDESKVCATITYQNFFRMYDKVSGMTGTAKTEEEEFNLIYNMKVIQIPTNKPMVRCDNNDIVYKTLNAKRKALINEIKTKYEKGQPVLVGTVSIESSEKISEELIKENIPHNILNAKHHKQEASIIAQAGRFKAITIATNMAGRGTDILLGGNPDFLAKQNLKNFNYTDEEIQLLDGTLIEKDLNYEDEFIKDLKNKYNQELKLEYENCLKDSKKVLELGGLCILGTERHESRRIDEQLRGRSGRQGDAGESTFFISLEDDLIRIFGGEKIYNIVDKLGLGDDIPLDAAMLGKSIKSAQKKVESMHFSIRKYLIEYDNVINIQRGHIYKERDSILFSENLEEVFFKVVDIFIEENLNEYLEDKKQIKGDINGLLLSYNEVVTSSNISINEVIAIKNKVKLKKMLFETIETLYKNKISELSSEEIDELLRTTLIEAIDLYWTNHIDEMEVLKQGINLRALGQQDPKQAYANEGGVKFIEMNRLIRNEIINRLTCE